MPASATPAKAQVQSLGQWQSMPCYVCGRHVHTTSSIYASLGDPRSPGPLGTPYKTAITKTNATQLCIEKQNF